MEDIRVEELMTRDVVTCSPDLPLLDVVAQLSTRKFSCIIVTEDEIPVGIITERDLVEVLLDTLQGVTWNELAIKNFMSSPVVSVREDTLLEEAVSMSHMKKIRHMPVVDVEGMLKGILTQTDLIAGCYQSA